MSETGTDRPQADGFDASTSADVPGAVLLGERQLRFLDGWDLQSIADALEVPLGTVKSRVHNALSALRDDPAALHEDRHVVVADVQGEIVAAGDLIGRLVMSPAVGSHVHWGVVSNHQQVCPRPYLSDSVESSLLALIREDVPSGEICY